MKNGPTSAVARTEPAPSGVREIERLYLEAIRSARESIYVENQYFSAESIVDALCERLAEPDGPEVVLVLPSACSGWIEERTMGARRARLLEKLREADRFDRFRAYAPHVPGAGRVNVHAKLMIVDDALVRIGSANLAMRSLGFDRECDLALESHGRRDVSQAIVRLRARLLGEHLGVAPERFEAVCRERGTDRSSAPSRRCGRGRGRCVPLEPCADCGSGWLALPVDPAESSEWLELLARWTPEELRDPHRRGVLLGLAGALAFAALVGLGWLAGPDAARLLGGIPRDALVLTGPAVALVVAVGVQLFLPVTALLALRARDARPGRGRALGVVGSAGGRGRRLEPRALLDRRAGSSASHRRGSRPSGGACGNAASSRSPPSGSRPRSRSRSATSRPARRVCGFPSSCSERRSPCFRTGPCWPPSSRQFAPPGESPASRPRRAHFSRRWLPLRRSPAYAAGAAVAARRSPCGGWRRGRDSNPRYPCEYT